MLKRKPTIFKTKAYKEFMKQLGKSPKIRVKAADKFSKEDEKKAKEMEKLINYYYKNNVDGITTTFWKVQELVAKYVIQEQIDGIQVSWNAVKKQIDKLISTNS